MTQPGSILFPTTPFLQQQLYLYLGAYCPQFSMIAFIVCLLGLSSFCLQLSFSVPRTNIGDATVACDTSSAPRRTIGFSSYYGNDTYACSHWNHKAKGSTDCFVALNGVCGMKTSQYCDQCIEIFNNNNQTQKCKVIDFCDPSNCLFLDPGHLNILNNNGNSHYKFTDKGKYIVPYKGAGGQPAIYWRWTTC